MPRNEAQAQAEMERWQDARAKEARRAAQIESERPRPKYDAGQFVEIKGRAVVNHTDETGHTKTDHQSATGEIVSLYWGPNWGCHLYCVKTEDGPLRGVPEHRLRLIRR